MEVRLCRALDIARRALDLFAVEGYTDAETPEYSFRPEKPIAETAMLLYAASAAKYLPAVSTRIEETASLLAPHARSQRTLLNLALHPSVCFDYAVPHVLLTKLGYRDDRFDEVLRSCINAQCRNGHERPPFASVEQRWIASLWTDAEPGVEWQGDLIKSVLYQPIDTLGGLRQDAYAFTHLVMYCTDFGFRRGLFPRSRSEILNQAQSLLARCLDEEDYDLGAEVLAAWPLSGAPWCASATFGFHVLASVEDQVGILPCGSTKPDRLKRLDGKDRTQYALGTAYHTALTMGLLCAASLRPGRAPFVQISGTQADKSFLDKLLGYLHKDQGHWQSRLSELDDLELQSLAHLLVDVAVVQNCRKHDYHAVSEVLRIANQYGFGNSPICAQGAQLLERLETFSSLIVSSDINSCTEDTVPA